MAGSISGNGSSASLPNNTSVVPTGQPGAANPVVPPANPVVPAGQPGGPADTSTGIDTSVSGGGPTSADSGATSLDAAIRAAASQQDGAGAIGGGSPAETGAGAVGSSSAAEAADATADDATGGGPLTGDSPISKPELDSIVDGAIAGVLSGTITTATVAAGAATTPVDQAQAGAVIGAGNDAPTGSMQASSGSSQVNAAGQNAQRSAALEAAAKPLQAALMAIDPFAEGQQQQLNAFESMWKATPGDLQPPLRALFLDSALKPLVAAIEQQAALPTADKTKLAIAIQNIERLREIVASGASSSTPATDVTSPTGSSAGSSATTVTAGRTGTAGTPGAAN